MEGTCREDSEYPTISKRSCLKNALGISNFGLVIWDLEFNRWILNPIALHFYLPVIHFCLPFVYPLFTKIHPECTFYIIV